ncbi:MAG: hypothetical protein A49_31660 [Methyloceanibacter sp.]|nr:MAG: hypothetical protein A49_31660 [Methyloceanibacter sp.]
MRTLNVPYDATPDSVSQAPSIRLPGLVTAECPQTVFELFSDGPEAKPSPPHPHELIVRPL